MSGPENGEDPTDVGRIQRAPDPLAWMSEETRKNHNPNAPTRTPGTETMQTPYDHAGAAQRILDDLEDKVER